MQPRERELGLRFHPGPPDQQEVICSCAQIVKHRSLADTGLAPEDQNAAAARPDIELQLTKRCALPLTTPQGPRHRHRLPPDTRRALCPWPSSGLWRAAVSKMAAAARASLATRGSLHEAASAVAPS